MKTTMKEFEQYIQDAIFQNECEGAETITRAELTTIFKNILDQVREMEEENGGPKFITLEEAASAEEAKRVKQVEQEFKNKKSTATK